MANANEEAPAPVTLMPVMDKTSLPVLVRVTDCDVLAVPTAWVPNDKLVAEREYPLEQTHGDNYGCFAAQATGVISALW